MKSNAEVSILLVEDDRVDAEALERAFHKQKIANRLHVVPDGIEALKRLRGDGVERFPMPYLVLLDLNTPRMNGIEFLQELRSDADLRRTIVIVLTTSNDDQDKLAAYDLNVAGYVLKSRAGEDFMSVVTMLDHYWRLFEFPPEKREFTSEVHR